jgi:hypothetical protein
MHVAATAPLDRIERRRLQRTTGGCSGRPAADKTRRTQRGSDAVRLSAASHVASVRPCLAASGADVVLHYAPAPSCDSDSGSTSSTKNAAALSSGRRLRRPALAVAMRSSSSTGRESYGGCALGVAAPNCVSELLSLAFHGCPADALRLLCHALRSIRCVHHCRLLPILVTLP